MIGQMVIATALPELTWMCSGPYFSFIGSFSPLIFYVERTIEENISIRSLNFCTQNAPSNSLFLAVRLSVRRFQMPLESFRLAKTVGTFKIVNATDSLLLNVTRTVCLC